MRIKVLNLDNVPDSRGEVFDPDGVHLEPTVSVWFDFKHEVESFFAQARLIRDGNAVYAEMSLTPAQLDRAKYCYPAVEGVALAMHDKTITKCSIRGIGLSMTTNQDSRILTIGEQVASAPSPEVVAESTTPSVTETK